MGVDGASPMSGRYSGAQALMKISCPNASYVHCASHCLNLVIARWSEVPALRNCWGTLTELTIFIRYSSKRKHNFSETIQEHNPDSKRASLKALWDTIWVEKQEGVDVFCELRPSIHQFLLCTN